MNSSAKLVAIRHPSMRLVLVALLSFVCTKSCTGIGWGKKTAASENDKVHDTRSIEIDGNMEKTYLDLFGESAKEFLTQKAPEKLKTVFPATDEYCRWDWRYFRCEPYCECSFQPKLPGDFHLGRACRKRSFVAESIDDDEGNENFPFETADDVYKEYCIINTNGDFDMASTPPPPSIPSPFPFLAKSGKTTLNFLRNKADPVLERAVDEFEILHDRIQSVVCQDLKARCSDDEITNSSAPADFAWQERMFCREIVQECNVGII